jgi:hypothetical protein
MPPRRVAMPPRRIALPHDARTKGPHVDLRNPAVKNPCGHRENYPFRADTHEQKCALITPFCYRFGAGTSVAVHPSMNVHAGLPYRYRGMSTLMR